MKVLLVIVGAIISLALITAGVYAYFDHDPNTNSLYWIIGGLMAMAATTSVAKGKDFDWR
jgi:hypothetical protein